MLHSVCWLTAAGEGSVNRTIVASSRTQSELTSHYFEIRKGNFLPSPSTSTLYSFIPNHITIYLPHRPQRSNPQSLACSINGLVRPLPIPLSRLTSAATTTTTSRRRRIARQAGFRNSCCSWRIPATYALQNCCTAKLHGS